MPLFRGQVAVVAPPQMAHFDANEQQPYSDVSPGILNLYLRVSLPATLWRKLISATCICDLMLSINVNLMLALEEKSRDHPSEKHTCLNKNPVPRYFSLDQSG